MDTKDKARGFVFNMKYNITINQKAVIDLSLDLDVVDMAIFDFIKDFSLSSSCLKVIIDGRQYFWISHSKIINDLPIIRIATRQGIIKRINKLIEAKLINRYEVDAQKSYYCFGSNYDNVTFVTERKQPFTLPVNESLQDPVNDGLHNYNTINYNTNDNKDETSLFSEKELEPLTPKKPLKEKKEKAVAVFFNESKWSDFDTLKNYLAKDADFVSKYAYTDLKYYINKADTWSENKQQKRTERGWLMTLRDWISEAELKGERVKIDPPKKQQQGHINH